MQRVYSRLGTWRLGHKCILKVELSLKKMTGREKTALFPLQCGSLLTYLHCYIIP